MVSREQIEYVINKSLMLKCPTISEMRTTLGKSSYEDHYQNLKEKELLNPLEEKDYMYHLNNLNRYTRELDDAITDEDKRMVQEWIDMENEELFQYGRRLIEGREMILSNVELNRDDYVSEHYDIGGIPNMISELEQKQITAQQESVNVDPTDLSPINIGTDENPRWVDGKMNDKRLVAMDNYFNGDCEGLNYWISHKGYVNALDSEQRKSIKYIDSLMEESTGLTQNTVLYRGGYFDIHTRIGETIKFKGYQSTSYSRDTAESYNESKTDSMTYVIHAPKGTKGIVGNDSRFENGDWEHEYVLPRNTQMKVVDIDYDNMVCEVVIE